MLLLLLLCGAVAACTPTRGGGGRDDDDDDDSAADDDDSTADDDDSTSGDDDDSTSGDDDDSTAGDDDDSTAGDDDDSTTTTAGELVVAASSTDFGDSAVGSPLTRSVSFSNVGGGAVTWSASLTWDAGNVFAVSGGEVSSVVLAGGDSSSRVVTYTPDEVEAHFTALVVTHDGSNASPIILYFTGTGGGVATESSCGDGVDNDGDFYTDCLDWDCVGSAACGDPCCWPMPWPASSSMCDSEATLTCLCTVDPYCCEEGWNEYCNNTYTGVSGLCAASPTCGN